MQRRSNKGVPKIYVEKTSLAVVNVGFQTVDSDNKRVNEYEMHDINEKEKEEVKS